MDFSNKVVIITGANSALAAATATLLSSYGAQLILVSSNPAEIKKLSDELVKPHVKTPLLITADVTKEEGAKRVERETVNHFGKVDVVVNAAGGMVPDCILKPDLKAFDENINLNLRSVYLMTTTFARHLMRSRGNIVNVGSVFVDTIFSGHVTYNIAKAGIEYLTKTSALELANKGVRVNCVKPGFTETEVTPKMHKCEDKKPWEDATRMVPLGKLINGRDIAEAIVFLASEQAKNITGTSIIIDGGLALSGTTVIDKIRTAFD
ncbi:3-oxoacyl-[acyl-carrier-protein] reductase FabG-like [Vanessa atalanta]|uniref:3-oxoacyl-[acyl-carrier-protein] reductase FabG-like n=1 Tax=Vanessa atalanta TaxID=42275 RepID=UPI001FCD560B|nr:3-oxoacyl-[acyl-carrier-protein] reductase FabG-like [Vanessa atalanta]